MRAWCALVVVVTRGVAAQDDLESGSGEGSGDDVFDYAALYDDANPEWGNVPEQPGAESQGQIGSGLYGGEAVFNHSSLPGEFVGGSVWPITENLVRGWRKDGQIWSLIKWSKPQNPTGVEKVWSFDDSVIQFSNISDVNPYFSQWSETVMSPSGDVVVYTNETASHRETNAEIQSCSSSCQAQISAWSSEPNSDDYAFVDNDFNIVTRNNQCRITSCDNATTPVLALSILTSTLSAVVGFNNNNVCKCTCDSNGSDAKCDFLQNIFIDAMSAGGRSKDGARIAVSATRVLNFETNIFDTIPTIPNSHMYTYPVGTLVIRDTTTGAHIYDLETGKSCNVTTFADDEQIGDFHIINDVFIHERSGSNIAVTSVQNVLLKNRDACAQLLPSPPPPPQKTETSSAVGVVSSCAILVLARLLV